MYEYTVSIEKNIKKYLFLKNRIKKIHERLIHNAVVKIIGNVA
jgi:hypothetical protein